MSFCILRHELIPALILQLGVLGTLAFNHQLANRMGWMFVIHCIQNDFSGFFESTMWSNTASGTSLNTERTICQKLKTLQSLTIGPDKSLTSLDEFVSISDDSFYFDNFNRILIVETFYCLFVWN